MLTIIGNRMGDYTFDNLDVNFCKFDRIICDENFNEKGNTVLNGNSEFIKEYILNNYFKENILYVVSGSPFFFCESTLIASKLPRNQVKMINNISCKTYMQEKMYIDDSEIEVLCTYENTDLDMKKFLINTYTLILCSKDSPPKIQEAIKHLNPQDLEVTIGYKLGYKDEIIEQITLFNNSYKAFDIHQPYVLVIKRLYDLKGLN